MDAIEIHELAADAMEVSDPIYDGLRFARTDPSCTRMVAARRGDELVGLGRLIDLGEAAGRRAFELGGIWVAESARRVGLAGRIVDELIARVPDGADLWCTPFSDLMGLYGAHGFIEVDARTAPAALHERLGFCSRAQDRPVLVTRWTSGSHS